MANTPFIYEFLYRGRPQKGVGSGEPGWHLMLGQYVTMPGADSQLVVGQAMTPEQAAAAGFPPSAIFADLNAAALASRDAAQAEVEELKQSLETAEGAKAAAEVDAATVRRDLESLTTEHQAVLTELAALRAQEAERDAAVITLAAEASAEAEAVNEASLAAHAKALAQPDEQERPAPNDAP